MTQPFVAEIRIFGGSFSPRGWAQCNGQLLPISQNTALFSLLGTSYGGDGRATFALPDLRDRFPMHAGDGPGLTPRVLGEVSGQPAVTLQTSEIPSHRHTLRATTSAADSAVPDSSVALAAPQSAAIYAAANDLVPMADEALAPAGGSQPHENRQPYLATTFIIALQGVYPARN